MPSPPPPRQNRVTPFGELIADPARGHLLGNRGLLHDDHGHIRRSHQLKRWIYCRLEFKGRRRQIMRPGHYTELFFWDEPTALAAGHRPCAECMRERYNEFREALGSRMPATELDELLHGERITEDGRRRPSSLPSTPFPTASSCFHRGLAKPICSGTSGYGAGGRRAMSPGPPQTRRHSSRS